MGYSDAGCYGSELATPNLDRLAANGLRYTQFYSTARCWPSRACLLTGYYAQQVRMDPPKGRLPEWARVLPHYLKPLGYRCYHAGKWHLVGAPLPCADGGFDHSYCIEDHNRYFAPKEALLDDKKVPPLAEGDDFYLTTEIASRGIEFLQEHAARRPGKPFFLYLAFTCPHFPLQARPEDIARYARTYQNGWGVTRERRWQWMRAMGLINAALSRPDALTVPAWNLKESDLLERIGPGEIGRAVDWHSLSSEQQAFQARKMAIHAAMIDRMDREIGRVLDQLKTMGAYENTVIFFASDNGASAEQIIRGDDHDKTAAPGSARTFLCLGPGWSTAANAPFRLHKSWVHEGGISSPLIVHWPQGIGDGGGLRHTPGHFIDFVPTMLELAGGPQPDPRMGGPFPSFPGQSLVQTFARDVIVPRQFLYWHHLNHRALRVGDWKVVSAGGPELEGAWELYNLQTDRAEQNDLAGKHPEKLKELAAQWEQCERQFRRDAGQASEPRP